MATMKELRRLAAELKAAYDLQSAAQRRQAEVRCKIVVALGQEEAREFLHMLRFQAEPPDLQPVFLDDDTVCEYDARVKFRVITGKAD